MGKKDTEKLLHVTMEFLEGLSAKQFQALVEGKAVIRFEPKQDDRQKHQQLKEKLKQESNIEKILNSHTKKELIAFCKYYKINIKTRDIKKMLIEKIILYIRDDKPEKELIDWKTIENELHNCSTLDEAKNMLANHKDLRLKNDLITFAKSLGIYVNKRYSKQEVLERIADYTTGARLRGKVIRQDR
ncbi:hypothetical protein [Virgibacillus doumboii]|uniref:hypothetical protein n=1 Tax=Virgibacillus doumboii TaxID=2697503 RepID=UPI0013E0A1AF|nr:hypothetical protein [Virgibacillus doumboii]